MRNGQHSSMSIAANVLRLVPSLLPPALVVIGLQDFLHTPHGFAPLAGVVDPLQFPLQIGGEVGVVILPVALHRLLHVHSAGRETARRLARRQPIALADLRGVDGVGSSVRLQPPPPRFAGCGLSMDQTPDARYRPTTLYPPA